MPSASHNASDNGITLPLQPFSREVVAQPLEGGISRLERHTIDIRATTAARTV
jgi:hypothetical protein